MFQAHLIVFLPHPWNQVFLQGALIPSGGELSKTKPGLGELLAAKVLLLPGHLVDRAKKICR